MRPAAAEAAALLLLLCLVWSDWRVLCLSVCWVLLRGFCRGTTAQLWWLRRWVGEWLGGALCQVEGRGGGGFVKGLGVLCGGDEAGRGGGGVVVLGPSLALPDKPALRPS